MSTARLTVSVDLNGRGAWDVTFTGTDERITCDTLQDASEVAHRFAAHSVPCELITRDAYHRVLCREYRDSRGTVAHARRREARRAEEPAGSDSYGTGPSGVLGVGPTGGGGGAVTL